MALKNKFIYWCCGGWIVDAITGWFATENKKIIGDTDKETGSCNDYKCTRSSFCIDMRLDGVYLYCEKGKYGKPECQYAVKVRQEVM